MIKSRTPALECEKLPKHISGCIKRCCSPKPSSTSLALADRLTLFCSTCRSFRIESLQHGETRDLRVPGVCAFGVCVSGGAASSSRYPSASNPFSRCAGGSRGASGIDHLFAFEQYHQQCPRNHFPLGSWGAPTLRASSSYANAGINSNTDLVTARLAPSNPDACPSCPSCPSCSSRRWLAPSAKCFCACSPGRCTKCSCPRTPQCRASEPSCPGNP